MMVEIGVCLGILLFFASMFIVVYFGADDPTYIPQEPLVAILLMLVVGTVMYPQLMGMSSYRRSKIGEILGLEEFIRTAEKDQLQQLQAEDEKYFFSVLPYAVAFGMADKWAEKFKDITLQPIDCYDGSYDNMDWIRPQRLMSSSMSKSIADAKAAAAVAAAAAAAAAARAASRSSSGSSYHSSSSYSSGGGGYSGGGFGGGGGGRW